MSSQTAVIIVIHRRNPLLRSTRVVLEYAITISIAVLASYVILGFRW
jgi:hypothetical protein